jgi:hypothetical protein
MYSVGGVPCAQTNLGDGYCATLAAAIKRLQGRSNAACRDLGEEANAIFSDPTVNILFDANGTSVAGWDSTNNTLIVYTKFFTQSAAQRAGTIAHEMSHKLYHTRDLQDGSTNDAYYYNDLCYNGGRVGGEDEFNDGTFDDGPDNGYAITYPDDADPGYFYEDDGGLCYDDSMDGDGSYLRESPSYSTSPLHSGPAHPLLPNPVMRSTSGSAGLVLVGKQKFQILPARLRKPG